MKIRGIAPIVIVLIVAAVLACGVIGYFAATKKIGVPTTRPVGCTMEAKMCPDGSAVGRSGPNCEFTPCPTPSPIPASTSCGGAGDGTCPLGYQCIQDCGPPVVREDAPPPGYHCIENAIANKPRMCPICLASNTEISTPTGLVNVKDMKEGMRVWSVDANGNKISSIVKAISHTLVPKTHHVANLVLDDGREVWVSPGHPTSSGQPVGELRVGSAYDGAYVQSADLVPYWDDATYDLLPDSASGFYWANDILLGSTLK